MHGLDEAGVPSGAGGSDCVVWAGDAHVDGDFTGGVVGYGAWVVVVGPEFGVVVEFGDVVDLVLGFDVAVLGGTYVDAYAAFIKVFEIDVAVGDGFMCAVDGNAACSCADSEFFALLIFFGIEVTDTCRDLAHVAHINHLYASVSLKKIVSIFFEIVAIWRSEADSCYDDT